MAAHRSWFCRLVERRGGLGLLEAVASQGIASRLERWALRHARRCAYCRAEETVWEDVVYELKALQGPAAPAHLLPDLLARITREPHPVPIPGPGVAGPQDPPRVWPLVPWWPDWLDWSLGAGALTILAGWAGALAAGTPALAGASRAVQSTAGIWKAFGASLAEGCRALAQALAPHWGILEELVVAGPVGRAFGAYVFWAGAGLLNAAALVLLVARVVHRNG